MKKSVKRKFLSALRSGKFKQTTEQLCEVDTDDNTEHFCCLGLLCAIHNAEVSPNKSNWAVNNGNAFYMGELDMPPSVVEKWSGLSGQEMRVLAGLNDNDRYTFSQIADYVEKHY